MLRRVHEATFSGEDFGSQFPFRWIFLAEVMGIGVLRAASQLHSRENCHEDNLRQIQPATRFL